LTWVFFAAIWLAKWGTAGAAFLTTVTVACYVPRNGEIDGEVCKVIVLLWLAAGMLHLLAK
jgi:hypothetical protein